MIKSFNPSKELVLEKNPYWDPATDPARTQYPDGYDFKLQQQSEKIDQIMLADTGTGQTTLTYDDLLAPDFTQMKQKAPDRLTLGGSPCTSTGRRTTGRSPARRCARLSRGPTRTRT
jgi:peptide/nickel transport system substrate-binding protein